MKNTKVDTQLTLGRLWQGAPSPLARWQWDATLPAARAASVPGRQGCWREGGRDGSCWQDICHQTLPGLESCAALSVRSRIC